MLAEVHTRPADTAVDEPEAALLRWRREFLAHTIVILIALALWAGSLPEIDLDGMTDFGLVSVLPAAFFAAAALLCVGFTVGVVRQAAHRVLLGYALAMLVILHATVAMIYPTPHYPYVYKHIAVTRYIIEFGAVDRTVDIYHNWPGAFAAFAFLSDMTGVDAMAYANWAEPFFALCGALGVYVLARSLTSDQRRVAATVWIYVLASCASQTYLSPQSVAFFLVMLCLGIAVRFLRPHTADSWSKLLIEAAERGYTALGQRVLVRVPRPSCAQGGARAPDRAPRNRAREHRSGVTRVRRCAGAASGRGYRGQSSAVADLPGIRIDRLVPARQVALVLVAGRRRSDDGDLDHRRVRLRVRALQPVRVQSVRQRPGNAGGDPRCGITGPPLGGYGGAGDDAARRLAGLRRVVGGTGAAP